MHASNISRFKNIKKLKFDISRCDKDTFPKHDYINDIRIQLLNKVNNVEIFMNASISQLLSSGSGYIRYRWYSNTIYNSQTKFIKLISSYIKLFSNYNNIFIELNIFDYFSTIGKQSNGVQPQFRCVIAFVDSVVNWKFLVNYIYEVIQVSVI